MTGHEFTPSRGKSQALPKSQAVNSPDQLELAIDYAPMRVRKHGLRETHMYPLVSDGKRKGQFSSFRVHASEAWRHKSLELRSANSFSCLILYLDGREHVNRLREAVVVGAVPEPNWHVTRVNGQWYNDFHWEGTEWVKRPVRDGGGCQCRLDLEALGPARCNGSGCAVAISGAALGILRGLPESGPGIYRGSFA